jgi:hypothetical protein
MQIFGVNFDPLDVKIEGRVPLAKMIFSRSPIYLVNKILWWWGGGGGGGGGGGPPPKFGEEQGFIALVELSSMGFI